MGYHETRETSKVEKTHGRGRTASWDLIGNKQKKAIHLEDLGTAGGIHEKSS